MNIALITAGGSGQRMNNEIPKQFINVFDKPLIIYTLEVFQKHPNIDAIITVCLDGWHDILKAYAKQFGITKLKWVVSGGANGQESIFNGIKKLKEECSDSDVVLVHDGNRPMVSPEIISDSISTCRNKGNAITAIPCHEVVFLSEERISSLTVLDRNKIVRTQTPHVVGLGALFAAHSAAQKKGIKNSVATCSLLAELNTEVFFSAGSEKNIKITTAEDLDIFKALLQAASKGLT